MIQWTLKWQADQKGGTIFLPRKTENSSTTKISGARNENTKFWRIWQKIVLTPYNGKSLQCAMPHDGKTTVYALWTKCKPIGSPEKLWSKMASKETSKTTNKNCSMYKKSESNSPIFYYVLLKCYQKYAGNLRGTLSFPLCIFIQKICFGEKKGHTALCAIINSKII